MALQAPTHRQWRGLIHNAHAIDPTMTTFTSDPFVDMNGMVEVDEVRQRVDAIPANGLTGGDTDSNQREVLGSHPCVAVARDAG